MLAADRQRILEKSAALVCEQEIHAAAAAYELIKTACIELNLLKLDKNSTYSRHHHP